MGLAIIDGLVLTQLKIIELAGGDVLHGMKKDDPGYAGFGEAYFSTVEPGAIKAWKRHREMTLNLVVPIGQIRFVVFDDREDSISYGKFYDLVLSKNNYRRLTVPPMVWMGFQGVSDEVGMLLNLANIPHKPDEADRKPIEEINFDWKINK